MITSQRPEMPIPRTSWPSAAVNIVLTAALFALTLSFLFMRVFPQTVTLSAVERNGQLCAFVDTDTFGLLRAEMLASSAGQEGRITELGPWMDAEEIAAYMGNPLAPAALDVTDGGYLVLLALPPTGDGAAVRQASVEIGRATPASLLW